MYGLPADFDPSIFVQRTLELICFSENTVNLHFDANLSVIVECAFVHENPSKQPSTEIIEVPARSSELMFLLGSRVVAASGEKEGTLILRFENGHVVKIQDVSDMYESYTIRHGEREIIV